MCAIGYEVHVPDSSGLLGVHLLAHLVRTPPTSAHFNKRPSNLDPAAAQQSQVLFFQSQVLFFLT
jgi:hypothetical protein